MNPVSDMESASEISLSGSGAVFPVAIIFAVSFRLSGVVAERMSISSSSSGISVIRLFAVFWIHSEFFINIRSSVIVISILVFEVFLVFIQQILVSEVFLVFIQQILISEVF